MLIDGIHVPLAVPFYRDGRLYTRKLEHNVAKYSLSPVSALVALAPGSEANTISEEEAVEVLQAVASTAAREKVLIAGIAKDSVYTALELAAKAEVANFDALLLSPPRDWRTLLRGDDYSSLMLFYRSVADAATLPVLLWSVPAELELPLDVVAELARHSNIVGLYDAGLTVERYAALAGATAEVKREVAVTTVFAPVTRRMMAQQSGGAATFVPLETLGSGTAVAVVPAKPAIKTRTKTVGFQIMAANDATGMLPLLQAGAAGAMPRLATCTPQGVHEVFAAFKDGDPALSAEKAERLKAADALMLELGVAGVKYGCDLNGYFGGNPRLPRVPLTAEQRGCVEVALRELKN